MRGTELLRLVWLNLIQNKFKTIMTSIGIVVGAATIVMVIAIGRGGQMDVAEQFSSLNAGAIDISYDYEGEEESSGIFSSGFGSFIAGIFGGKGGNRASGGGMSDMGGSFMPNMGNGNAMPDMSGMTGGGSAEMPDIGNMQGGSGEMPNFGGDSGDGASFGGRSGDGDASGKQNFGGDGEDRANFGGHSGDGDASGRQNFGGDSGDGASFGGRSGDGDSGEMPDFGRDSEDRADLGNGTADGDPGEMADADNGATSDSESMTETDPVEENDNVQADAEEASETEENLVADRMNQENIILSIEDVEDIEQFVSGITGVTISYSSRGSVEGGNLTSAQSYTIAGVKESYASVSNLEFAAGEFLTEIDDHAKARVCVLGASAAKEIFGSADAAYEQTIYIEDRTYTVIGVLKTTGTVSGGISPDDAVFVPYETGIKYITGESISPTITVIAENVDVLDSVISQTETVLAENYSNADFTFTDAGSKMEAAESSNRILTMLLSAMAVIVFIVGGIGIMNVLFVSVKERTSEIGILKSLGASRQTILLEFLLESAAISMIGGLLGVAVSFAVTPIVELYDIRVEASLTAWAAALGFAVLTGTLFGFYPALKASRLVPVEALNAE